ncbi:LLM class flavin-dependent oxidoreductase [Roseateles terrae]|uniref:FMN-dependent oxidoreductase (Nitrilotriacetate monooxygenase family) n=1 Tax=Roseateles terrae TaxID=431060 RepID=A0ABR6GNM8_9BURK|nr:LLM class flavin-dependent oxidoreductase [Roseateles terrae]MBB3193660.1 FMN-dependent oxidoreductase (nitrilotriacetate monooxygenase family) [Roseateles terrae]OWQ89180.1 5,10-methylene tetrahydromethanopterin reductase [Roseateles terrae]
MGASSGPKPIRFNAFTMNTVGHQSPGLWTHPRDQSHRYTDPQYWQDLARLLERGQFDSVFLADVLGVYDVFGSSPEAALRHAVQVPLNDPLALVPLMAAVTEHLGFGVTCALSYEHPYSFARRLSTLDHLTRGRVGWNIVTGYLDSAARNLGQAHQKAHDERYDQADEYLEVVYKLWEHSWEDGAVQRDKAGRVFTDASRVHPIAHDGPLYQVPGIHLCEPSPQRTPVLFQAGASSRGRAFAGRHAECVFVSGPSVPVVRDAVEGLRAAAVAQGRQAEDLIIYGQALIITGETEEEALRKRADYLRHVDLQAALALLSGWTGVDFSRYPPDATIEYLDTQAGRSALASFSSADPSRRWTVGEAAAFIGLGGRGPVFVGDAAQVADQLIAWQEATGLDGFNLTYAVAPDTFEDVVTLVVPELQRRGRYSPPRESASTPEQPTTLRQRLFGRGDRLAAPHPAKALMLGAFREASTPMPLPILP